VIAIIGILASVVLVNLNSARTKAKDAAALATGMQITKVVQMCDIDGGKVVAPAVGGNICNLGGSYGVWPLAPSGWTWTATSWVDGENNLFHLGSTYNSNQIHCGHYIHWGMGYCSTVHVGICRMVMGYSCSLYDSSVGFWK
jgi:type II secretory pathway pseudopilin PulG